MAESRRGANIMAPVAVRIRTYLTRRYGREGAAECARYDWAPRLCISRARRRSAINLARPRLWAAFQCEISGSYRSPIGPTYSMPRFTPNYTCRDWRVPWLAALLRREGATARRREGEGLHRIRLQIRRERRGPRGQQGGLVLRGCGDSGTSPTPSRRGRGMSPTAIRLRARARSGWRRVQSGSGRRLRAGLHTKRLTFAPGVGGLTPGVARYAHHYRGRVEYHYGVLIRRRVRRGGGLRPIHRGRRYPVFAVEISPILRPTGSLCLSGATSPHRPLYISRRPPLSIQIIGTPLSS